MNRVAWQATVHGVARESDSTGQLNNRIRRGVKYDFKVWPKAPEGWT